MQPSLAGLRSLEERAMGNLVLGSISIGSPDLSWKAKPLDYKQGVFQQKGRKWNHQGNETGGIQGVRASKG